MPSNLTVQLVESNGTAHVSGDSAVTVASTLTPISQTAPESRAESDRPNERGMGSNDNIQLPFPLHPSTHINDKAKSEGIPLVSCSGVSGNALEQPEATFVAVGLADDDSESHVKPEPNDTTPGRLFGEIPSVSEPTSASSDRTTRRVPGNGIDLNFSAAWRKERTSTKVKAQAKLAVETPGSNGGHCLAESNYPPKPVNRPRDGSGPKGSKNGPLTRIPMRKRLADILPIDTRERLSKDSGHCVASTKRSHKSRCKNRIEAYLEHLEFLVGDLTGFEADSADDHSLKFVERLIQFALCGCHKRYAVARFNKLCEAFADVSDHDRSEYEEWIRSLATGPPLAGNELPKSFPESTNSTGNCSTAAASRETPELSTDHRPETRSQTRRRQSGKRFTGASEDSTRRASRQTYIQEFQPYQPKCEKHISVSALIRKKLMNPLTSIELKSGFIYMYWFPGNFGYLKIGYTTVDSTKRLKRWQAQCKHTAEGLDELYEVPHASRVEKLIHAELKDVRRREVNCQGCFKNHREWFRISARHAKNVFIKYAEWMKTQPYV